MNPIKLLILTLFAPKFWTEMPDKKLGKYNLEAYSFTEFRENLRFAETFSGTQRAAYIKIRWTALMLDFKVDSHNGRVGIGYRIEEIA